MSGHCGRALRGTHALHIAADPLYDVHGRRYPPGWVHMHDVHLDEQAPPGHGPALSRKLCPRPQPQLYPQPRTQPYPGPGQSSTPQLYPHQAAAASGIDLNQIGFARASPRNLATWAGALFDANARTLACVDVALLDIKQPPLGSVGGGSGEWTAATVAAAEAVSSLEQDDAAQLVPALWRLGCRLPAVVVNGGCCRAEVGWAWPEGVPVVLVTGGHDFFNEHLWALQAVTTCAQAWQPGVPWRHVVIAWGALTPVTHRSVAQPPSHVRPGARHVGPGG